MIEAFGSEEVPIRFAVTKLVTRRPVYRGFLQDGGHARR